MSDKTLLLVDGSSYLYRAFHALPDLRNKGGEPTGAIYGMVGMLRRLRNDSNLSAGAQHGAVVFDAPGKTFRDALYPQYKANRTEMPSDLVRQIEPIHRIVRAMGWPLLMIDGIEADDVIGTLAAQAQRQQMRTVISTGDKDLAQLVGDRVVLVNTMSRDGGPGERLDRDAVIAKFGVPPERIVDYFALIGDAIDNVPGIPKVGPKTAAKWIAEYGSLEGVIANAARVGGAIGENLRAALDWLPQARQLLTVKCDCDLSAHVESIETSLRFGDEDVAELIALFDRFERKNWKRELESRTAPPQPAARPLPSPLAIEYETVRDEAALERWLQRIDAAPLAGIAVATTSLDPFAAELVGVALALEPGRGCYVPVAHRYAGAPDQIPRDRLLERLRGWLQNPQRGKTGYNLKFAAHVFANHGVPLEGIAHDALLQSYVLEAHRSHALEALAERHLGRRKLTLEQVAGKGASQIPFEQVPLERATECSAEDAEVSLHLHRALQPAIDSDEQLRFVYERIEMPMSIVLQKVERTGVLIDAAALSRQSEELGSRMLALERDAHEAAGQPFNMNSPKQLCELLFDKLKLPVVKRTASGAPSTDEEVLDKLAQDYPLPRIVLDYRALSKLKSTYTDKLPRMVNARTGRVHTCYSQAVAVTGRLSSTEPNLQNIPIRTAEGRRIREAFVAPPGSRIVSADYSQVELRIMAHISGDAGLTRAFTEGLDVHRATAAEVFGTPLIDVSAEQRRYAKTINFGLIYGMSAFGLAANLGIERDAARNYIERYFARYPDVARYMNETRVLAKQQGFVRTIFGRKVWLAEINSPNGPRRQAAERAAINAPMQGTAADLIKLAMIAVQDWIERERLATRLVMQVHDELVFEVPEPEVDRVRAELPGLMSGVAQLAVPLVVDVGIGRNWDEAH